MRYLLGFLCVCALGVVPLVGCGQSLGPMKAFPCTEQGIREAIAEGGGLHTFSCDGPTTVVTEAEIVIDNDVLLDGEGNLTVDGDDDHLVFLISEGVAAELRGLSVTRSTAATDDGGITNTGTLRLTDSTVSGNGNSGIVNSGTLTLTDSTVSGNGNAGIVNSGTLTVTNTTVSGSTNAGIHNYGTVMLTDITVSGNGSGGIYNAGGGTLTVTNSTVSGNGNAGIVNSGTLTVTNSTVSGNDRSGIHNEDGGTLRLTDSTVSGNTVIYGGGGGIRNNLGTVMLTNCTVSGNTADSGGGIRNNLGTVMLTNCTVSGNTADDGAGIFNDGGTLTVTNTLVDDVCGGDTMVSGGNNIESPNDTCGFDQTSDQPGVSTDDLKLGPLADNGGPTMTHALLPGSVAINVIREADCVDADGAPLTTDQRGEPRPETGGTMCDVGAFEVQP
ncbi:MAG: right-handed parallel beta-helix repeat-containing protein [Polyangiales bacterium]